MGLISDFFKNYVNFSGRTSRKDFWLTVLIFLIIEIVFSLLTAAVPVLGFLVWLFGIIIIIPSLAICARRLRDAGFSPWWLLIGLTGIGTIVLLIFFLLPKK